MPMVTTRNTNADEQGEMIRILERRLEEIQKQHEEDMTTVRAECAAQITRAIAARGDQGAGERRQEKTVVNAGNEGEEHSSAPTQEGHHGWAPVGRETRGG